MGFSPEIITIPNPVLFQKSEIVKPLSLDTHLLIERMRRVLISRSDGVGLAAPQIGQLKRVFLMREKPESPIFVYLNPEIINSSLEKNNELPEANEGCLSAPGFRKVIERYKSVQVMYESLAEGKTEQQFTDWAARIVQHEIDHLNGILITSKRS